MLGRLVFVCVVILQLGLLECLLKLSDYQNKMVGLELRLSNQGCVNDIFLRQKLALPTGSAGEWVSTVGI